MRASTHRQALRVGAALGPSHTVVEFDQSTHTAQEAADAIGCQLGQIAKSILFRSQTGKAVRFPCLDVVKFNAKGEIIYEDNYSGKFEEEPATAEPASAGA